MTRWRDDGGGGRNRALGPRGSRVCAVSLQVHLRCVQYALVSKFLLYYSSSLQNKSLYFGFVYVIYYMAYFR